MIIVFVLEVPISVPIRNLVFILLLFSVGPVSNSDRYFKSLRADSYCSFVGGE
jgi:hypothetical protein